MTPEARQYLWLRLTVLGTGLAVLASLLVVSIKLWPMIQQVIMPTKLTCGCAVLAMTSPWWMTTIAGLAVVATLALVIRMTMLFINQARRSHRQAHQLYKDPVHQTTDEASGVDLSIIERSEPLAMTLGLIRPRVYISRGLIEKLTSSELQAVIAHEQAHQRAYDPLVTALMSVVAAALKWLPGARDWMAAAYSLRELAADATATNGYRTTAALSSAFIKLSDSTIHPALSAFSPNRDRLEKLLDHQWTSPRRWWNWSAAMIVGLFIVAGLSVGRLVAAKNTDVPPMVAATCHETMVMCLIEHQPIGSTIRLCSGGRCEVSTRLWSPLYAWTPAR